MAYDINTGEGPTRPKWLVPAVIGGIVLLVGGIVVAVVLVLRSRAGGGTPAAGPSATSGQTAGAAPSGAVPSGGQQTTAADQTPDANGITPAMRAASQKYVQEYLQKNPPQPPDYSNIKYNFEYSTTDPAMKDDLGFPDLPVVKYEYLPPPPGSTAPVLVVTNAPTVSQPDVTTSAPRVKSGTATK